MGEGEPAFEFYSQQFDASTKTDGSNQTVTMFAGVPDGAGISEVRFSYLKGATPVEIGEVAPNNGIATLEWTPPGGAEGAAITGVRAEALAAAEVVLVSDDNPVSPSQANGMGDNAAIEFAGALRSRVGLGPDGEVVIAGTTTAVAGLTFVQNAGPSGAAGPFVNPLPADVTAPNGQGVSNFKVAVPVTAANNTGDAEDEIIVRGVAQEVAGTSDDVHAYTMYNQVVTAAGITVAPGFPANIQLGGANDETRWNITVTDQEGQPIQGVNVFEVEDQSAVAPPDGSGNATPNTGETNVDGVATVSMFESTIDNAEDADGDPNNDSQTAYYVVDADNNGVFNDGVDYRFTLVQSGIIPVATSVEITSELGNQLDDDEVTDIVATVRDQNGQPIANKPTVMSFVINCFDAAGDVELSVPFGPFPIATDGNGQITVPFGNFGAPCEDGRYEVVVDAFANNNGTPQPDAGDAIAPQLVLDFDTTHIEWENGDVSQAENGTTTSQTGTLVQDTDGDALGADRIINITYNPADNSEIATTQTAPTQRVNATTATSETNAQGQFTVNVSDPAVPDGQELGSLLTAEAPGLESGGADQTDATIEIDFLRSIAPDRVRIINPVTGDESDGLAPGLAGDLIPGGLGLGEVEVENSDGVVLTDVDVELTIEEGHFIDLNAPFENAAPGNELDFSNAGQTATVTTDDGGSAQFVVNIERNTGFDDDGEVDDNMTADAGNASDTHDLTWTTNAIALNNGSFTVELSEDQESTILPQARAGDPTGSGQVVDYDVVTTDQFGNRTRQPITVTDNTPLADFFTTGTSEYDLTNPAIQAFADSATNQELEVELNGAVEVVYADNVNDSSFDPNNPGLLIDIDPVQLQEDTAAINWYDLDLNASTFTLSQDGAQTVPVQSAVTMVLNATDQEGQALTGLGVDFLRGGPGDEDDDGCQFGCYTVDEDGNAFYDFVGGSAGTATVSAVVYDDNGDRFGTVGTDTVIFGGGGQVGIQAKLSGKSKGGKDILKVDAPSNADGAKVKLQKKTKNGWKQISKAKALNLLGNTTFKVADKNGNKVTRYRALVAGTNDTKPDTSNVVRLK